MRLKNELVEKVEGYINLNWPESKDKLRVADVNIVFKKDPEILSKLLDRGVALSERDWEKRDTINTKLTKFVSDNNHSIVEP